MSHHAAVRTVAGGRYWKSVTKAEEDAPDRGLAGIGLPTPPTAHYLGGLQRLRFGSEGSEVQAPPDAKGSLRACGSAQAAADALLRREQ